MGSEPYFLYLQKQMGPEATNSLILVAGAGNSLGSFTTYFLGRMGRLEHDKLKPYIPVIQKYGVLMGLISPLPLIGDILVAGMGFFRCGILMSFTMITIAKFLRYYFVSGVYHYFL